MVFINHIHWIHLSNGVRIVASGRRSTTTRWHCQGSNRGHDAFNQSQNANNHSSGHGHHRIVGRGKKHHISLAISERCPEPILDGLANIETDSQIVSRPRAGGKNHFMREWSKEIEESILDGLANIDTDPQHDHSERIKNGLCPWFATWEYVWPGETEPRRVCSSHMEHVKTNAILCRINLTSTRIADPTSPNNSLIYCEHDMIERRKQAAKAQKPAPGTLK
jgi:hypothetical protein